MRKYMASILVLVCALALVGCNEKEVNIDLPFAAGDVESVELYYYEGAPVAAEKKVVDDQTAIKNLYDMFEGLALKRKAVEETAGARITSFRFNLSDGTTYELIYECYGVKTGKLKSVTDTVEYFTSADIGACWDNIDLAAVPAEESELPKESRPTA